MAKMDAFQSIFDIEEILLFNAVFDICIVKRYWWSLHVIIIHKLMFDLSWLIRGER